MCVLVQGASGCGKSTLLREYAGHCGRKEGDSLMVVHQGEQIDSKVCVSNHCASCEYDMLCVYYTMLGRCGAPKLL